MTLKRSTWSTGRVVVLDHTSKVLAGNRLGDPVRRPLTVWLPPQYDEGAETKTKSGKGRRFPVLYDMVGFTAGGPAHVSWRNFDENVPERAARLIHEGKMGPCLIVFPDCFTALGGNQYINSSAVGRYADYLVDEIVPTVDRECRTLASRDHRGCFGKSSGGYGAIVHGMKYADTWGAVADHSGDSYFEFVYMHDWPRTLSDLQKFAEPKRVEGRIDVRRKEAKVASGMDDGRIKRFLDHMWTKKKPTEGDWLTIMNLCMAATYDPDRQAPLGFRIPFNLETGELLPSRWEKWRAQDPVNMVGAYRKALKSLRGIYIDCGWNDQYHIHYGTRILSKRLAAAGIAHTYEEFDDNHSGVDYRMDVSLPFLYRALKP
jgi:enterochelin esterase-like enzyme